MNALLWTAPELLTKGMQSIYDVQGSMAGDVYSYGVIMVEVLTNALPYQEICLDARQIVEIIAGRSQPPPSLQIATVPSKTVRQRFCV